MASKDKVKEGKGKVPALSLKEKRKLKEAKRAEKGR
jgi:hypothetical protein